MRKFPFVLLALVCFFAVVTGIQKIDNNHDSDNDDYEQEYEDIIGLSDTDTKLRYESLKTIFSDLDDLKQNVPKTDSAEESESAGSESREGDELENTVYRPIDEDGLEIPVIDTSKLMYKDDWENSELKSPYDELKKNPFDGTLGDVQAGQVVGISYDEDDFPKHSDSVNGGRERTIGEALRHDPEGGQIVEEIRRNSVEEDDDDSDDQNVYESEVNNALDAISNGVEGYTNDNESDNIENKIMDEDKSEDTRSLSQRNGEGMSNDDDIDDIIGDDEIAKNIEEVNGLGFPETPEIRDAIQSVFEDNIDETDSESDEEVEAIEVQDIFNDEPSLKVIPKDNRENENERDSEDTQEEVDQEQNNNLQRPDEMEDIPESDIDVKIRNQMLDNEYKDIANEMDDQVKGMFYDDTYGSKDIGHDETGNDAKEIEEVEDVPPNDNLAFDDIEDVEVVDDNSDDDYDKTNDDDEDLKDVGKDLLNKNILKGMLDSSEEVDENDDHNDNIGDAEKTNDAEELEDDQKVSLNKNIEKGMLDDTDDSFEDDHKSDDVHENIENDEVKFRQNKDTDDSVNDDIVKGMFDDDEDNVKKVDEHDDSNHNIGDDEKLNMADEIDNIEGNISDESDGDDDESMYGDLNEEIRKVMQEIEEVEANLKSKFDDVYGDDGDEGKDKDDESDEDPNETGEVESVLVFNEVSPINNQDEETVEEPAYNVDSIPETAKINAPLISMKNLDDAQAIEEPTSTITESRVERLLNVVELSPETRITLTSPGYPEPYQSNITMEWQLTGESGTGIEINVTMIDLNGYFDDNLLIKPGNRDSDTDSILLTFNINEDLRYRFHDYNEAYVRFVSNPKPEENQEYQGFSLSAKFIDTIQEVIPATDAPLPLPAETHRVFLGGTTPSNFLNISEEFRQILVDMVVLYINENGIDAGIVPVNEVLQMTFVSSCQLSWPDNDNCVAVRYGASFIYDNTQYDSDVARIPEMSEESLNRMWNTYHREDPFAARMQRLGVWDFVAPDDAAVLTLWLLISGGVVMVMVLLSYAIWRWNCFEEYTAMSRYSDTESVISKKSDASLYPTPHQHLPPMFATPRDSLGIWSDQFPPKYDDSRFPEPGRSYDNRSFVRDGEFFDLESDEEIVMSLPDGPGAGDKYQMKFPQRYSKDAEA